MAISNEQLIAGLKKNPLMVAAITVSIAMAAGLYFRGDLAAAATTELEAKAQEGQKMINNIKNSSQLKAQLATVTTAVIEMEKRLVKPSQLAANLQYFYEVEVVTETKLVDLRQMPISTVKARGPKTVYQPVTFAVSVVGTYPRLIAFLQKLERGDRYCRILDAGFFVAVSKTANFMSGLDRPDTLTLNLNLELLGQP